MKTRNSSKLPVILLTAAASLLLPAHQAPAADALQADFSGAALPSGWTAVKGDFKIENGALIAAEKASDMHNGVLNIPRAHKDIAVKLDFRFEGAKALHLSFNLKPGGPRKGHLYRVALRPDGLQIIKDGDKAALKPMKLAEVKTPFETGKWYTLEMEQRGGQVTARVGDHIAKAEDPDLALPKPGLRLVVTGQSAWIDNLKVSE
jgi:hypothetical protein